MRAPRAQTLRTIVGLVFFAGLGAFLGARGIPFTLPPTREVLQSAVDCRPTSIRLTASSDVLQTVYTLNAYLENWRGDLIVAVDGGCPQTPTPEWRIDPPTALVVQPHFPNYAEIYPLGGIRDSYDYLVTVTFHLPDGDVLRATKGLHIPPRRNRHDELARRILAGPRKERTKQKP